MSAWQSIKTAPKDGRSILGYGKPAKGDKPRTDYVVMFWCSCLCEWHLCDGDEEPNWLGMTHWMPLPKPPKSK